MSGPIAVWGAGGHARVVAEILRLGGFTIAGFLDDVDPARRGEELLGARVLGGREELEALLRGGVGAAIVAVGDNTARLEAAAVLRERGFELPVAVHPAAVVAATARIGAGSVVCAAAVVGPAAVLGRDVIVNTAATVDHDCAVEDGAHLAPGVHLGGWATVGRGSFVGLGALVADRARVGAGSVVGAGSLVLRDVPAGVVAWGSPARVVRPA